MGVVAWQGRQFRRCGSAFTPAFGSAEAPAARHLTARVNACPSAAAARPVPFRRGSATRALPLRLRERVPFRCGCAIRLREDGAPGFIGAITCWSQLAPSDLANRTV
jgi:hypothetical protein